MAHKSRTRHRDGDLDILFGETSRGNHIWCWENPYPTYGQRWNRHLIKDWGGNQSHDQIFGDFDGDREIELAAWNQRAGQLLLLETTIPALTCC